MSVIATAQKGAFVMFVRAARLVLLVACVIVAVGCDERPERSRRSRRAPTAGAPRAISDEDRALLEQKREEERQRTVLQTTPGELVTGTVKKIVDDGIVNPYCRATEATFRNASSFLVASPSGTLSYFDERNALIATVPFSAEGEIPRQGSAVLRLRGVDTRGKCRSTTVLVNSVVLR